FSPLEESGETSSLIRIGEQQVQHEELDNAYKRKSFVVQKLWDRGDIKVNLRAVLCEFIGTAMMMFVVTMSGIVMKDDRLAGIIALGLGILALIHGLSPISGAHFNPAVTLAALITRHIGIMNGFVYMIAQALGSILGCSLSLLLEGVDELRAGGALKLMDENPWRGLLLEVLLTFFLITVVYGCGFKSLHFPGDPRLKPFTSAFSAVPVAGCIIAMSLIGKRTGCGMNPVRVLGPELLTNNWNKSSWVYYIGPIVGASLAAFNYEFIMTTKRNNYWQLIDEEKVEIQPQEMKEGLF
ncbi:TIP4-2AQP5, partial [Acrasis kona]